MKDRDIFERTSPAPTTLLGLKLRPFALGHLILLHRVESAFAVGGLPSYDDLALAVFICSRPYADALAGFSDPDLPREMKRWARKLTHPGWFGRFRQPQPIDLPAKWAEFQDYLDRNSLRFEKGKDFITDDSRTRKVELPFVHAVRVRLQSKMRFSDAEILDRSWALCLLDYFILADADGVLQLTGELSESAMHVIRETQAIADRLSAMAKEGKRWP
jgi:hypothetical protein